MADEEDRHVSRQEAIALGLKHYFTGKSCKRGHVSARYVSSYECLECSNRCQPQDDRCQACKVRIRADNKIGYCRKHRKRWVHLTGEKLKRYRDNGNAAARRWEDRNREKKIVMRLSWVKSNPEKVSAIQKRAYVKRRKNPMKVLCQRMRGGIWASLRKGKNGRSWEKLVGYSRAELKSHLERLFTEGMTWEKFMSGKIHIDHIRPISSFSFVTAESSEFLKCWSLKNLQPLWAADNIRKWAHLDHARSLGMLL